MNLASFFLSSAERFPQRVALSMENKDVSYGELRTMVLSMANSLPQEFQVAILASRSTTAFAGVLGILASGAAYVPLNPSFPTQRNKRILELSKAEVLVVGEECAEALAALLEAGARPRSIFMFGPAPAIEVCLRSYPTIESNSIPVDGPSDATSIEEPRDGTAYILFTSGSTGDPKGVRVTHSNVSSYLRSIGSLHPIHGHDRLTQTFDLTFDLSVHDQFVAWKAAATLVVFPAEAVHSPLDYAIEKQVSVWFSVPSLPAFLESSRQARDGALPGVRLSLFCGEKFTWNAYRVWRRIAPNSECCNIYGPTEATIAITSFDIPEEFPEEACYQGGIPIGKPFPGQSAEIRRPDGSSCAQGEHGMLWLGGDQVTRGYLDPEKTAEVFVERDGMVWYRSGDVAFVDLAGDIHYVGREDFQVKLMGYRIELGEIESTLQRISGVALAIADVARLRGDVDEIVCVLPSSCASRKNEIRKALKETLPAYMIPRVWKFQDDLPYNANGKIDRNALKAQWRSVLDPTS